MQGSLPAGWLAFTGRELNPLDRDEGFQITSSSLPGLFLAQRPKTCTQSNKAALLVVPLERSRTRKVWNCKTWRPPDQDWRTPFRRPKISFNQGVKWKADINKYIDPIPPNGDAPCMAEQNMSCCPLL